MATEEARKDLAATVEARRELGAEYEPEIIDAFLEKVDARIAERTQQQPPVKLLPPPKDDPGGLALAIVSVVAGIPITGIAASQEGLLAIFVCWGGLVGINLARAVSRFVAR